MYVWECQNLVRLRACEGKLAFFRERHGELVAYRDRYPKSSIVWQQTDINVRRMRQNIERELDEIAHCKAVSYTGHVIGGEIAMGRDFGSGPTIIELVRRETENPDFTDEFKAGIAHALEVMYRPYNFLNEEEREGFRKAEQVAKLASEQEVNKVTPKRKSPDVKETKPPAAKATILRINPQTGKAERTGV